MGTRIRIFVLVLMWFFAGVLIAEETESIWDRETLTGGFWGLNEALEPTGIDFSFSLNNIYQINTKGGTSTHRRQGRWSGSYDLEMNADLEKLFGIENAILYMHTEGTWSRQDIDGTSVESAFGVNGDFAPREAINVVELWYQQTFFENTLYLRLGKLDMAGGFDFRGHPVSFDGNQYANDENTQFLNSALVNNPTIPFPDYGLAAIVHWHVSENWYVSAGAADAQADKRETGFNTAFRDEDYFVYMAETGFIPFGSESLPAAYRLGIWYDPQPKAHSDTTKEYRDDMGIYVSCDQKLTDENTDPEDTQGLGGFFRYGYAPSKTNDLTNFYSFGIQYQGLLDGRDEDVLGLGYAHGSFSDRADVTYTEDYESVTELYYNAQVTQWMSITPSVQYVTNPGGNNSVSDAVVAGVRALITF